MDKILIVDNDPETRRMLRKTFMGSNFVLSMAGDPVTALSKFKVEAPSIVIVEPRVPGLAGQEFFREIRRRSSHLPILVLSWANAELDKVLLLEFGADDYITKPFNPRELIARVRVALRRLNQSAVANNDTESFGDIRVHFENMEVTRNEAPVQLTALEFKMLRFFVRHPGRVIPTTELVQQVWDACVQTRPRTVATHILRLRQKLESSPGNPIHFRTVRGTGYMFVK
jgi:DNA-binding response OmpR family regulator